MNFTEAVAAVLEKVKRPDKLGSARLAVNAALLLYSNSMNHSRDIVELVHVLDTPDLFSHTIPLATFPRYRKIKYIRYPGSRIYVTKLDDMILCPQTDVRNKYYEAGNSLSVNLATKALSLEIAYFQFPPVLSDASPTFWQLDANWPAVIHRAASQVFTDIGDAQAARDAANEAAIQFAIFTNDAFRGGQNGP